MKGVLNTMKVLTKSLLFGALSLALVACGTTEDENNGTTGGADQTNTNNSAENNNDNDMNEANENASDENDATEEDGTASLPVTIIESDENELHVEFNGEEYSFDAELLSEFDKEIKVIEGMSFEHTESEEPTAYAVYDEEDHFMKALTLTLEERFLREAGEEEAPELDVENEMEMERFVIDNASHSTNVEAHELDESTPFHFYVVAEGDASGSGSFSEEIRGGEYRQYTFVEVTDTKRYRLMLQFPADVDEEFEAAALAMALSYQSSDEAVDADDESDEDTDNNEDTNNNEDNNEDDSNE